MKRTEPLPSSWICQVEAYSCAVSPWPALAGCPRRCRAPARRCRSTASTASTPPPERWRRQQQALEVLARLRVPGAGLGVAGHAGGLDHPLGHPVGGFRRRLPRRGVTSRRSRARARRRGRSPRRGRARACRADRSRGPAALAVVMYDRAVPVEHVGDDQAGGLARPVGAEDHRGDAVVAGQQPAAGSPAAGDQAPPASAGFSATAIRRSWRARRPAWPDRRVWSPSVPVQRAGANAHRGEQPASAEDDQPEPDQRPA